MRINLTDNNMGQVPAVTYDRESIAALFPIADRPISDLCKENENLLVFPHSLGETGDGIGDSPIFSILNTSEPDKVTISTGNIMGFIGVGGLQVKIQSRFDAGREDYFLHYMLQKVLRLNLFDLRHDSEEEEVFDFLMFMFPIFLANALRQGVYREYQRYERNDANVSGPINVAEHIRRNMPFAGRIAYSVREFSQDNSMTELVRHTIEYMSTRQFGKAMLNINKETAENVKNIVACTPSYERNMRNAVIQKNLRHKVHPYYTEYSPLRVLCLQILRMEDVKYGESDDEISGILFDGAWLWEEYVNTILCLQGFEHPENKLHRGAIYLFEDIDINGGRHKSGPRYPDFYKENVVLDAKYKRLESYSNVASVDRDDIHQIITYMEALEAIRGGFIAPLTGPQTVIPTSHLAKDPGSTISIFGIEIARANSYESFAARMFDSEQNFQDKIKTL